MCRKEYGSPKGFRVSHPQLGQMDILNNGLNEYLNPGKHWSHSLPKLLKQFENKGLGNAAAKV